MFPAAAKMITTCVACAQQLLSQLIHLFLGSYFSRTKHTWGSVTCVHAQSLTDGILWDNAMSMSMISCSLSYIKGSTQYGVHIYYNYSFSVAYQIQSSRRQWELNGQILSLSYNHSYAIHGKKVTIKVRCIDNLAVCMPTHQPYLIYYASISVQWLHAHFNMMCPWVVLSL